MSVGSSSYMGACRCSLVAWLLFQVVTLLCPLPPSLPLHPRLVCPGLVWTHLEQPDSTSTVMC
jgi:hypothetical protein